VYSRGRLWPSREAEGSWTSDVLARFPQLAGRLFITVIPGSEKASFRDPVTVQQVRGEVARSLALPVRR
jgi:hypothetical protein